MQMKEEEFKSALKNLLMMQNNNDRNFEILQHQIDNLQKQITDLNDLKEMFRLPKVENKDRKYFDTDESDIMKAKTLQFMRDNIPSRY